MGAGGPKTKFKPEYVNQAYVACKEGGFTRQKLAKLFSVSPVTIHNWCKEHDELLTAIKKGKDEWDSEKVEKNLLKRAMGFKYKESKSKPDDTGDMKVVEETTKLVIPDTTAQIFWLKNRQPQRWRDSKQLEVSNDSNIPAPMSDDITENEASEAYRRVLG